MSDRLPNAYEPLQLAKILRIRAELAAGTYHISTEQLAESLIRRAQGQIVKEADQEQESPRERH